MANWWDEAPVYKPPSKDKWWEGAPVYHPSEMTLEQRRALALASARQRLEERAGKPSVAEDVARTIPAAGVRAAASVAGAPAGLMDTADWLWQQAVSRALQAAGVWTPEQAEGARQPIPGLEDGKFRGIFPKAEVFTGAVEKATGEPLYRPQTTVGEYVGTAVEMAPSALMPGTAAQRVAQVAVPALVSETAGQTARKVAPDLEGLERPCRRLAPSLTLNLADRG